MTGNVSIYDQNQIYEIILFHSESRTAGIKICNLYMGDTDSYLQNPSYIARSFNKSMK